MRLISRLEQESRLDAAVSAGQRVARLIRPGKVRDALHGVWLGHPVHPMLVQASTGAWLSASILDLTGAGEKAARRLVAAGIGAAVPAALAGAADWSEQHEQQMRVGVVHALVNTAAGLAIGIPAMMFYAFFRGRAQKLISELEAASTHVLALLSLQYGKRTERMPALIETEL